MRTYIRTLFNDIFKNNLLVKFIVRFVNFCCKYLKGRGESIKFSQDVSIEDMKGRKNLSFQSVSGDEIDCK